jgi:energy-coupling factor transporter ATP-binding protein EcfA2
VICIHLRSLRRSKVIVGPSGSGKSSLARAGLIAALKQSAIEGSTEWPIVIARPGADPLASLAVALSAVTGTESDPAAAVVYLATADNSAASGRVLRQPTTRMTLPEAVF